MPIIQFNLLEGRSVEQKRRLAAAVTDTVVEVLGVKREQVRILVHTLQAEDFSIGGVIALDKQAQTNGHANGSAASPISSEMHNEKN